VTVAVWLLWVGLAASLSLSLLNWPIMFIISGSFVATAVIFVSIELPTGQLENVARSAPYVPILAASIGVGIFLQVMPLQFMGVAQPFWSAMGAAIRQPTAGFITVDTASTVVAMTKYLVILGAALVVALSCTDQLRGAQMSSAIALLLMLFSAACLLKASFSGFRALAISEQFWSDWISLSMLGILMNGALMIRHKLLLTSRRLGSRSLGQYVQPFAAGAVMIALFAIPLIVRGSQAVVIPTVFGISAFLTVFFAKRMASGVAGLLFAVALVICGLWLAGLALGIIGPGSTAALGNRQETDIATAVRIFRDFHWFGSGAGTYSGVVPMYEGFRDGGNGLLDTPPVALSLLIELGIPLTLLGAVLLLVLVWAVFSAVSRNDRDYSQAVLACSTLVYVIAAAFTLGASLSFSTVVVAAVIISLGLTQAQLRSGASRSLQEGARSGGPRLMSGPHLRAKTKN
jgi:hypothetical protein